MYNLSEYMILSRSAYIAHSLRERCIKSIHEETDAKYDMLSVLDNSIVNFFQLLYPTACIDKYIVSRYERFVDKNFYPIYLLTIENFNGASTLIAPIYITIGGVYIIKTIYEYDEDSYEEQPLLIELMNIYDLTQNVGPLAMSEFLKNNDFIADMITSKLQDYHKSVGYVLERMNAMFSNISEFNIKPTRLDAEESMNRYIKNNYVLNSNEPNRMCSAVISPDMFLPLVVKQNEDENFLTLKYEYEDSKQITSIHPKSVSDIDNIITDSHNKILVKAPDDCEFVIIDINNMVYIGNGKLVSIIIKQMNDNYPVINNPEEGEPDSNPNREPENKSDSMVAYLDLCNLSLFEEDVVDTDPKYVLDHNVLESKVATESLAKDFKSLMAKAKEVGMDFKSDLMPHMRKLIGLPKDVIQLVYKTFLRVFNVINDIEKNKALDYQEKVLNDELSNFSETMEKLCSNSALAAATLLIPTSLICKVIIFLILKAVNNDIRIKALERVEHKFEDMIRRVDKKIEFATQEYNKQAVNELMKEKAMYMYALERLLEVKKKVYNKDRKRSAYKLQNDEEE